MREIKFRAWVKDQESWLVENGNRMIEDITSKIIFESVGFWSYDELDYMQFTGLYDKNGKEIYEADVVKSDNGFVTTVEWFENGFYIKGQYPFDFSDLLDFEVIGNKFENPELLSN